MFYIDLLRGHKLLMNSGLSGRERVGILTATGNRTDYKAITMGLRQQWEDAELRQRDGHVRQHEAHHALWGWPRPESDVFSLGGGDEPPAEPQYPAHVPVEEPNVCGVSTSVVNSLVDVELDDKCHGKCQLLQPGSRRLTEVCPRWCQWNGPDCEGRCSLAWDHSDGAHICRPCFEDNTVEIRAV